MNKKVINYEKYYLDHRARDYLLDKMNTGTYISQSLLKHHLNDPCKYYIITKSGLNNDSLYTFPHAVHGADYMQIWRCYFEEAIEHLKKENAIIIFEDSSARKNDPCVRGFVTNIFFKGDRIFHYLLQDKSSLEKIEELHSWSTNAWQNVFFFSFLPDDLILENDSELSDELIDFIGKNAVKAFVDAYDLDSYLCWELL